MSTPEVQEYWEQHYGARGRIWSGRVNARLAEVLGPLLLSNRSHACPRGQPCPSAGESNVAAPVRWPTTLKPTRPSGDVSTMKPASNRGRFTNLRVLSVDFRTVERHAARRVGLPAVRSRSSHARL
jgi:hypothetical protein